MSDKLSRSAVMEEDYRVLPTAKQWEILLLVMDIQQMTLDLITLVSK